jgi:cellobiose epimerase
MSYEKLNFIRDTAVKELFTNILPFWINVTVDEENGGYYGWVEKDNQVNKKSDKGCVLNSRLLWTFSSAYRLRNEQAYMDMAKRAYYALKDWFWDYENKGLFWMVDYKGNVVNSRKQIYNLAFGIYGLVEYHLASNDEEALKFALELFELIEQHAYDNVNKGYIEALDKEWNPISDLRLSSKDMNEKKSMNTHLHVLEAYTSLYRVWNHNRLEAKLQELIQIILRHIIDNEAAQFNLFFDEDWKIKSCARSFGHDIEGSWLLWEAAEVLKDKDVLTKVKDMAVKMAWVVYKNGLDAEFGGLFNESHPNGDVDMDKTWWVQAEAVVGFFNAWELTREESFLDASISMLEFIDKYISDKEYGEWRWKVQRDGSFVDMPKVEPWKCPYHNSRAYMELINRIEKYKI